MASLNEQCLTVDYDIGLTALTLVPQCFEWMRDHGYPVEDVSDLHAGVSVKEDSDDEGYLVAKIDTLSRPTEEADIVEDGCSIWCCSCPGFHYHEFPDLAEESITNVGACSHIEKVRRQTRAETVDESQETLA